MKTLPYMPFFIDDYEAHTAHLTALEDGYYMRLLRLCWRSHDCTIPADEVWIARKTRASQEDFETFVAPLIAEFFTVENGRIYQKRLLQEWRKSHEIYLKRVTAGRKGGKATQKTKPLKSSDFTPKPRLSNHNHNHTPTVNTSQEEGILGNSNTRGNVIAGPFGGSS